MDSLYELMIYEMGRTSDGPRVWMQSHLPLPDFQVGDSIGAEGLNVDEWADMHGPDAVFHVTERERRIHLDTHSQRYRFVTNLMVHRASGMSLIRREQALEEAEFQAQQHKNRADYLWDVLMAWGEDLGTPVARRVHDRITRKITRSLRAMPASGLFDDSASCMWDEYAQIAQESGHLLKGMVQGDLSDRVHTCLTTLTWSEEMAMCLHHDKEWIQSIVEDCSDIPPRNLSPLKKWAELRAEIGEAIEEELWRQLHRTPTP